MGAAGIDDSAFGVVVAPTPEEAVTAVTELLKTHRVWERFHTSSAN
ncbi:hypothetical protein [Rhodococcus globerulus]